jgi:hypothetical protein
LDSRFASRPDVAARLHAIADLMDRAIAEGATADQAEEMAIAQLRQLGADVLTDYGRQKQAQALAEARQKHPAASLHVKKK